MQNKPNAASPITALAQGILYRAVVSLPAELAEQDRPHQERIVFFEAANSAQCSAHLEQLLAAAWCTDTRGWCEQGHINSIHSAHELLHTPKGIGTDELRLLALADHAAGGVGPDRICYARGHDVDLLVSPRVVRRLRDLAEVVEDLYAAEPVRRAAAG